jgi:hypothetical protein
LATSTKHITEIQANLERFYGRAHKEMERADRMHNQDFSGLLDVPYEIRVFLSSTAANIIDGYRNQIRTNEPTVNFQPASPTRTAERHAVLMKKWGYGMLERERIRAAIDPNLQCGFDLLLRGAACKKVVVDVDNMMGPPPKKSSRGYRDWEVQALNCWPYVSRAIDPMSIFPAPGDVKPLPFIIEKQRRPASQMWAQYPDWKDPKRETKEGKNPARLVTWLEYWSKDEYIVEADGEVVFERENPYGFVPYIFEWSGLGRAHSDSDPVHLATGILTHIIGELEEEVRLKTAISVQTQMHVFPPILTTEDPRKVAAQFGLGPGKVIRHPPGQPPVYMNYPAPNENLYRFLTAIQENISRTSSAALSGGRDPGVQYGVLQAQMVGQALTTIAPIRATLDGIATQTITMMASMARKLDLHMSIQGTMEEVEEPVRVEGKDFGHLNFNVSFEAVDPAENDRALMVGEALRRAGDISQRTFWEKYLKHVIADPDQEYINLWEESILQHLLKTGSLSQIVMDEAMQAQIQEKAEGAAQNAQKTLQGGAPPSDTISVGGRLAAQEMERISGTPGAMTPPREMMARGMDTATKTNTGIPRGG